MKKLLIFTIWQINDGIDLGPDSNLWYVRRYEEYFDEITHVYLCGNLTEKSVENGNSRYVSVGSGNFKLDLLLSPYRLYKFAKEYKPYAYLTVEQVWLFWVVILVKVFLRAKIYLLPITFPQAMYKLTKKSLSLILPIWLEEKFISLSYLVADKLITSRNLGNYVEWMSDNKIIKPKLVVTDSLPESIPTIKFFDALREAEEEKQKNAQNKKFELLYVGRLHREKSVDHLVRMMAILKEKKNDVHLTLIGEGSGRKVLEDLTEDLNLTGDIKFLGWKTNNALPYYMTRADAFVSPSTGGSLREAALCGLPVVAYHMDWIKGLLKDGETFLAVKPDDVSDMASKVEMLINNSDLRIHLAENLKNLGWNIWSDNNLIISIKQIYD